MTATQLQTSRTSFRAALESVLRSAAKNLGPALHYRAITRAQVLRLLELCSMPLNDRDAFANLTRIIQSGAGERTELRAKNPGLALYPRAITRAQILRLLVLCSMPLNDEDAVANLTHVIQSGARERTALRREESGPGVTLSRNY